MELRHLRYFLAVADELHFGRAADRLLIAAPSLSQQIKALEKQLKVQLFDRSSTGVALTDAGVALVPKARATVDAAEEVLLAARSLSSGQTQLLRVGFQSFAFIAVARELLSAYAMRNPDVDIQVRQFEWDDPSAGLLADQVDVALVRTPFRGAEALRIVELYREPLLLAVREGHPLSRLDAVPRERLVDEPFLESPLVTDPIFAAYWYLRDVRRAEAVISRATTVEEWLAEITLGRGVNLIPASFAEEYRRPGIAFVPVLDLPDTVIVLAWRSGAKNEPVMQFAQFAARESAREGVDADAR